MNHRMIVTILSGFVFLGCEPGAMVNGNVVDADNNPLSGADVSIYCEDEDGPDFEGDEVTDASGDFSMDLGIGCIPDDCEVESSEGKITQNFKVGDHCHNRTTCRHSCAVVYIDAQLQ